MTYPSGAKKILNKHSGGYSRQFKKLTASQTVKTVHDLRVAFRRLKNAFRLFARVLPEKKTRKFLKKTKPLDVSSAGVRDLDVMIRFIQAAVKEEQDLPVKNNLTAVVSLLKTRRKTAQIQMKKTNKSYRGKSPDVYLTKIIDRFEKLNQSGKQMRPSILRGNILSRITKILSLSKHVRKRDIKGLHELRKAVKKLRYTLEDFQPNLGKDAPAHIKSLIDIQEILGEIHDQHVREAYLTGLIKECRANLTEAACIESALCVSRSQTEKNFHKLIEVWMKCSDNGLWESIEKLIKTKITG